jgi:hypothetical protein
VEALGKRLSLRSEDGLVEGADALVLLVGEVLDLGGGLAVAWGEGVVEEVEGLGEVAELAVGAGGEDALVGVVEIEEGDELAEVVFQMGLGDGIERGGFVCAEAVVQGVPEQHAEDAGAVGFGGDDVGVFCEAGEVVDGGGVLGVGDGLVFLVVGFIDLSNFLRVVNPEALVGGAVDAQGRRVVVHGGDEAAIGPDDGAKVVGGVEGGDAGEGAGVGEAEDEVGAEGHGGFMIYDL